MSTTENLPRGRNYNRANLSVMKCASKDPTRFDCCSVAFDPNGQTIATDGHTMAVYTPAGVDRRAKGAIEKGTEPIAVELECIKAIHKTIGANGTCNFKADENGGTVAFTSKCITLPTVTPERRGTPIEYPQWTQVLPSSAETVQVRLDARYLKRIAEAAIEASELGRSDQVYVDVTIDIAKDKNGKQVHSPVSFEHETDQGAHFLGLIMPVCKD